jgi:hypothetical protein
MPDRIKSVIEGRDNDVLDALFGFYSRPEGIVVDVTSNARRMWKKLDTSGVIFCDISPSVHPDVVADFRQLPFADNSISAIVFDPPHLPMAAGTDKSLPHFVRNYGLSRSVHADNISSFFIPFLLEANRVLKDDGLVFAKLADFVHNHKYQWSLVDWVNAVRSVDGLTPTDLIIKRDPCAGNLKSGKWEASYHARRSHCWYSIVRKGKCEPKTATGIPSSTGRKTQR